MLLKVLIVLYKVFSFSMFWILGFFVGSVIGMILLAPFVGESFEYAFGLGAMIGIYFAYKNTYGKSVMRDRSVLAADKFEDNTLLKSKGIWFGYSVLGLLILVFLFEKDSGRATLDKMFGLAMLTSAYLVGYANALALRDGKVYLSHKGKSVLVDASNSPFKFVFMFLLMFSLVFTFGVCGLHMAGMDIFGLLAEIKVKFFY